MFLTYQSINFYNISQKSSFSTSIFLPIFLHFWQLFLDRTIVAFLDDTQPKMAYFQSYKLQSKNEHVMFVFALLSNWRVQLFWVYDFHFPKQLLLVTECKGKLSKYLDMSLKEPKKVANIIKYLIDHNIIRECRSPYSRVQTNYISKKKERG